MENRMYISCVLYAVLCVTYGTLRYAMLRVACAPSEEVRGEMENCREHQVGSAAQPDLG